MKTTPAPLSRRHGSPRRAEAAFTLIELLTVMAIIVVLAGIFLGVAHLVQDKAARSLTATQIKAIGAGITGYESDNGSVPRDIYTDNLDAVAMANGDPAVKQDSDDFRNTSLLLFRALSGYYTLGADGTYSVYSRMPGTVAPKTYYEFKPAQFPTGMFDSNGTLTQPGNVKYVLDPYGVPYGYSTLYQKKKEDEASAAASPTPGATPAQYGYNPTYDLWSTGGYGSGKPYPSDFNAGKDRSILWMTNWRSQ